MNIDLNNTSLFVKKKYPSTEQLIVKNGGFNLKKKILLKFKKSILNEFY